MSVIRQKIRNLKYGTKIRSVLTADEHLTFQNTMNCSTNNGKLWSTAVIGLSDKRLFIEWQKNKGKNIAIPYEQIKNWKIHNEMGGLSGLLIKNAVCVDIAINNQLTVRIAGEKSVTEILVNQLKHFLNN